MPAPDIRAHVKSLVGASIETVSGQPNEVLRVDDEHVYVRTGHTTPTRGEPVRLDVLEEAADRLWRDGEIRIDVESVGYRSAFVGAVLASLPGTQTARRPARVLLLDGDHAAPSGGASSSNLERWWSARPDERFWLEVSDRHQFGHDLRAPNDARTSHALVDEVRPGEIVFHYDKRRRGIIGWSKVVGRTRRFQGERRAQLEGMLGATWVSLARLREFDADVRKIADRIQARGDNIRGFPFERSASRPIRPLPAYLAKLPAQLVEAIPELAEAAHLAPLRRRVSRSRRSGDVGRDYRTANESVTIPLIRSPETAAWRAERTARRTAQSTSEHNRLQNKLRRFLDEHGVPTLSPDGDDIPFDLAWRSKGVLAFAEIKSISAGHESQRLRLGLGQCLFYRHALEECLGIRVPAFLVIPREPDDPSWLEVCHDAGAELIWPERFAETLNQRHRGGREVARSRSARGVSNLPIDHPERLPLRNP